MQSCLVKYKSIYRSWCPMSNWSIPSILLMMAYGLGMMLVIFFIRPGIPKAQTKTSVSKQDSHVMKIDIAAPIHSQFYPLWHIKVYWLTTNRGLQWLAWAKWELINFQMKVKVWLVVHVPCFKYNSKLDNIQQLRNNHPLIVSLFCK